MEVPKRLQLQLEHISDLIREQNRMAITEIEPTETERRDVLSLLDSIRSNISAGGGAVRAAVSQRYDGILKDLSDLGYSIQNYKLEEVVKPARKVHFASDVDFEEETGTSAGGTESVGATGPAGATESAAGSESAAVFQPYSDNAQLSSAELFQQNTYLYEEQDRRLLEISDSVGRQRRLGEGINSELDVHNSLLDDLESQTEHSQHRLDRLTNGVRSFNHKSRECGVCSIILALVLILFILLLI